MCKKRIQIDGLDCCLGEESADGMFGTYLTHPKQDTRYNSRLVFFLSKGARRIAFIFFFLCYYIVLLRLLILILKIHIMDTMKAYFCYRHMLL